MFLRSLVAALYGLTLSVSGIQSTVSAVRLTTNGEDAAASDVASLTDVCMGVPRNTLLASCPAPCASGAACIAYDQKPAPQSALTGCDYTTSSSDAFCSTAEQLNATTCEFQCFATFADKSAFRFFVPFESQLGDPVARAAPVSSLLDRTTSDVPFQSNNFVRAVGKLKLSQSVTQVSIAGGWNDVGTSSEVATVTVDPAIFVDAAQVTSVSLRNMDLRLSISRLLLALPNGMKSLNLANTRISKLPDAALTHMDELETLALSQNQLTSISTKSIELPKLKSLYLSENSIKSFDVAAPNLETLDLSGNDLSSIPSIVYTLPKLRVLKLDGNPIKTPVVVTDSQAKFLRSLEEVSMVGSATSAAPATGGSGAGLANANTTIIGGIPVEIEATLNTTNYTSSSTVLGSFTEDVDTGSQSSLNGNVTDENRSARTDTTVATTEIPQTTLIPSTTDNNASTDGKDKHQSSPLVVVLIVVGVVVATLGLALGFTYQKKRKLAELEDLEESERSPYAKLPNEDSGLTTFATHSVDGESISGPFWADSELFSYRVRTNDIDDVRIVGTGTATVVWLVHYRGGKLKLASKRLCGDDINALKLVAEVKLAASLNHHNIVQFFGVAWTNEKDLQALYEYMPQGDLHSYFSRSKVSSASWQWLQDKIKVAYEVIDALVYAHSFDPPLLHRDLRSKNVLLDGEFKAKLSDFGSPISFRERSTLATFTAGSGLLSLAPEILSNSSTFDTSSDIYSFGVLLTELDTHQEPFAAERESPEFSTVNLLVQVSSGVLKPKLSDACPPAIRQIARACMSFEASHRPTAIQVASMLKLMLPPGYGT